MRGNTSKAFFLFFFSFNVSKQLKLTCLFVWFLLYALQYHERWLEAITVGVNLTGNQKTEAGFVWINLVPSWDNGLGGDFKSSWRPLFAAGQFPSLTRPPLLLRHDKPTSMEQPE